MFCPKCGSKIPDGSKFCESCGENLTFLISEANDEQAPAAAPVPTPVASTAPAASTATAAPVTPAAPTAPVTPVAPAASTAPAATAAPTAAPIPNNVQPKKKGIGKMIILIAAAAVVVVGLSIAGLVALFSSSGSDNAYAYLSDGKYKLITNINRGEAIEIASSKSDSTMSDMLAFSPDGKYIYYYTKYDSYTGTGSLCRAEYGRLQADSNKNEKYIEVVATNVSLGFRFLSDGSLTYKNGENTLYHFDGKEISQIAKNVSSYFVDENGRIVYTSGDSSDGINLYSVAISDMGSKNKLASNVAYVVSADDFDNILYTKRDDNGSETLYVVGFEKEVTKLGENVNVLSVDNGKTYFTAEDGTTLSLYDFVDDAYADADAVIKEPTYDDFSIPRYSYEMVYGNDLSESDFDELYTSCTRSLYWYGKSTWWAYSMEEALDRDWGEKSTAIHAATQRFIDRFGSTADENGYILVTDEVKAALKEIAKYSDDPEDEWNWLWLCYNKYQSGTSTDYDAYNAASDKWYEARNRISMRETLQNKENDFAVHTLYCYENGALTTVSENVLNTSLYNGAVMYNTTDMISDTVKLENVSSTYDILQLFYIDIEDENHIVLTGNGSSCKMSSAAAETYAEAYNNGYASLWFTDNVVYLRENDGTLSSAATTGGVIENFKIVTDDADILSVDGSTLYYASGSYRNNDVLYGDVYSYADGASTLLARDVVLNNIRIYDDGVVMVYTGYRSYYGYELTMIDSKGEATFIADNVTQYIRVDNSTLLYISDGDLYSYNGKERTMVQSDVDWFWSRSSMDILNILGSSDYYSYY